METSTYDPCLLTTKTDVRRMLRDCGNADTLILDTEKEEEQLKEANFQAKPKLMLLSDTPLNFNATGKEIFRSTCGTLLAQHIPEMRNYISRRTRTTHLTLTPLKNTSRDLEHMKITRAFNTFGITKSRRNESRTIRGRDGIQDRPGYWIYKRKKPMLVQSD